MQKFVVCFALVGVACVGSISAEDDQLGITGPTEGGGTGTEVSEVSSRRPSFERDWRRRWRRYWRQHPVADAGPTGGGSGSTGGSGSGSGSGSGGGSGGGSGSGSGGGSGRGTGAQPINLDAPLTPGSVGTVDVTFTIRSNEQRHPISPLIYGTNQPTDVTNNRYGLIRKGGNRLSAYNWENNASNAGLDYLFQNDGYLSTSNTPGAAQKTTMDSARSIGAAALVTIPMLDYVAADKLGGGDVRQSGSNYLQTRFKQNRPCSSSAATATPNTTDGYVNQCDFVAWVEATRAGAPVLFSLDNEPDLWADTHAAIHPTPVGYLELVNRTIQYATMAKSIAPTIPTLGFVSYGWQGFINLQSAPDASGNGEFIDYFLKKLKAAETTAGHRLVDYLDLHWYPEARGGNVRITGASITTEQVQARVQAPRSLWDPTYTESSWIASYVGGPIALLPRIQAKVNASYPGTKLAFTEWNYGAGDHISGGVATADVLGIFGRESVGLASLWKLNGTEAYNEAAIRAFRNYDGANNGFGDTSIFASTSDRALASIYASVDAKNAARTVLVAVNKSTNAEVAGLSVAHPLSYGRAEVYVLTGSGPQLTRGADLTKTATNAFRYTMPPLSVSVLVLKP